MAEFRGKALKTGDPTGVNWNDATANERERVGVKIRAIHVHDCLDSTHGALHHGCYLCVSERVTAYSGRHVTDFRHVMTNPQKIPPPERTIPCDELIRQGGPHGDGQRHRAHGKEARDDEARLFSKLGISTTQAISMFLKQAVREQRIPFEVTARPTVECGD